MGGVVGGSGNGFGMELDGERVKCGIVWSRSRIIKILGILPLQEWDACDCQVGSPTDVRSQGVPRKYKKVNVSKSHGSKLAG